ncbi:hypothetical protein JT359_20010 [Candidatus Poribacteria bacterium]|nr:hypothetical protein [Candidatus Poribacteria bacterium]
MRFTVNTTQFRFTMQNTTTYLINPIIRLAFIGIIVGARSPRPLFL